MLIAVSLRDKDFNETEGMKAARSKHNQGKRIKERSLQINAQGDQISKDF